MSLLNDLPLKRIQFYLTAGYPCSYLPDRQARSQVAAPSQFVDEAVYSELIRHGFRRSGLYTYRPLCDQCQACTPVRVNIADFSPDRSQRRAWKKHSHLQAYVREIEFVEEHYQLYLKYQTARHAGGGMDQDDEEQYRQFLLQSNVRSLLIEFREGENLRIVCLMDQVEDGLSSVYTFYDPEPHGASFGTYCILWQIALAKRLNLPYLYLGYWIGASQKMAYKDRYQPLEKLISGHWQRA